MNHGWRFVILYRRQGSRPSPRKRNFCDSGHQTGMRWHPIVVLICIPQILSYVKDLSCALDIHSFLHVYSTPLAILQWSLCCCLCIYYAFMLFLSYRNLYILDIKFLSDIWFANNFCHSIDCLCWFFSLLHRNF